MGPGDGADVSVDMLEVRDPACVELMERMRDNDGILGVSAAESGRRRARCR